MRIKGPLVAALVLLAGCTVLGIDGDGGERERLAEARRQWLRQGFDDYAYTLQRLCFCAGGTSPAEVVVRDGARVSVTVIGSGEPVPEAWVEFYLTVPELFAVIEEALDRDAHEVDVSYDGGTGVPVRIRIDYLENAIDEEMGFDVSAFRALR